MRKPDICPNQRHVPFLSRSYNGEIWDGVSSALEKLNFSFFTPSWFQIVFSFVFILATIVRRTTFLKSQDYFHDEKIVQLILQLNIRQVKPNNTPTFSWNKLDRLHKGLLAEIIDLEDCPPVRVDEITPVYFAKLTRKTYKSNRYSRTTVLPLSVSLIPTQSDESVRDCSLISFHGKTLYWNCFSSIEIKNEPNWCNFRWRGEKINN